MKNENLVESDSPLYTFDFSFNPHIVKRDLSPFNVSTTAAVQIFTENVQHGKHIQRRSSNLLTIDGAS